MRKYLIALCLLFILSAGGIRAEGAVDPGATETVVPPPYGQIMLANSLLPGLAQFWSDKPIEASVYLAGAPLQISGLGLMLYYYFFLQGGVDFSGIRSNPGTYPFKVTDRDPATDWVLLAGTAMTAYGALLGAYSNWAAHRDYMDAYGDILGIEKKREGREGLVNLLLAPYLPENVFSLEVFPILGITAMAGLSEEKLGAIRGFFSAKTQKFMGISLPPGEAFGLRLASAWLYATASSTWEEIVFRGIALEREGMLFSTLSFGLGNIPDLILPEVSIERTALKALSSLAFGFYAANLTQHAGYRIEKAIALNFWSRMISTALSYLVDPESDSGIDFSLRISF